MDKIEIENYQGWTIYFDKEQDRFYSVSQSDDVDKTSKSFTAAKKAIDDYLKDNQNFKPFKVMSYGGYSGDFIVKTIVGQRKDGRFIIQKDNADPEQLSAYNEGEWIEYKEQNTTIVERIKSLKADWNAEEAKYRDKLKALQSQLIIRTVKDIRKDLTGKE
jgi:hypothetical protein